jgi:hypothetical protein
MPRPSIAGLMTGIAVICTSCSMPQQQAEKQEPMTTGLALARVACPHQIAAADAWINHMPGPGRAPRTLNVDVRLAEATDTAVLLRSAASTGDTLILEMRTSPAAPIPGRLAYREPVPDPLYKRISFFCRGGEVYSINTIERVY